MDVKVGCYQIRYGDSAVSIENDADTAGLMDGERGCLIHGAGTTA